MPTPKNPLTFNPRQYEEFVVILTGGVMAGSSGIGFVNGHIVHIPGNNPEAFDLIRLGFQSLHVAATLEEGEMKKDLLTQSAKLVQEGQQRLEREIKNVAGKAA
jgi:hypothetical protein